METLKKELDDIINIDDNTKNTILNVFNCWNSCKNNHQVIENINNSDIIFSNNYSINNNLLNYDIDIDINKRTLYIDKCNNLNIKVNDKFNHIIIINSSNINITILEGLIGGIDIIHCDNIKLTVKFNKINNINYGYSNDCKLILDKNTGLDIYISTSYCVNILFMLIYNNILNKYLTNRSFFSKINYYFIDSNMLLSNINDKDII